MDKYRADPAVANSDTSNILISDELFLAVKKGDYRIPRTPVMKAGTIAHSKILTPEIFWDEYYITAETLHVKQKEFVDNLVSLMSKKTIKKFTSEEIEDVYESVYTKPKKGDGVILFAKLESHVMGAISRREGITMIMNLEAEKRKQIVKDDPEASKILEASPVREEEIFFTLEGVECKAKLDAYGIDDELKKITLGDLKISKDPISREEAIQRIKERDYVRQTRFYEKAIRSSEALNMLYEGLSEYTIDRFIIYVDPVKAWVIQISDETAIEADERITRALNRVKSLKEKGLCKEKPILI